MGCNCPDSGHLGPAAPSPDLVLHLAWGHACGDVALTPGSVLGHLWLQELHGGSRACPNACFWWHPPFPGARRSLSPTGPAALAPRAAKWPRRLQLHCLSEVCLANRGRSVKAQHRDREGREGPEPLGLARRGGPAGSAAGPR